MNGKVIAVVSSKQKTVITDSTSYAECAALLEVVKFGMYIYYFMKDIECIELPFVVYTDNMAALKHAINDLNSDRSKHWDVKLKLLHEYCKQGIIDVRHKDGTILSADIFTKILPRDAFEKHRRSLGIY